MTERVAKLRLTADSTHLQANVRASRREMDGLAHDVDRAGSASRRGALGMERFGSAAERVSRQQLSGLNSQLGRFGQLAAGVMSAELLRRGVAFADSYANIQSRLELATGSLERYQVSEQRTFAIAQKTYTALESTATLYGRMQAATDQLGRSQEQAFRSTELINKTFQISGAEAAAANAAIVQLSQGLSAGALRGDEFNSVMEQAPRFAAALAKGMNVARGELRAMADQGKLTADVIIDALLSQGDTIDKEFQKLPLTAARAWQQLENVVLRTLGQINQQTATTRTLGEAIQGLAAIIARVPNALEIWIEKLQAVREDTGGLYAAWSAVVDFLTGPAIDELMILPVTLGSLITIAIGEFDKLRISAGEQFDLLVINGQRAWNSLDEGAKVAGLSMALAVGQSIDGILRRYADLIRAVAMAAEGTGLDGVALKLRDVSDAVLGYAAAGEAVAGKIAATRAEFLVLNDTLTLQEGLVKGVAQAQREAADDAIRASMAERDAALAKLNAEKPALVVTDQHTRAQKALGASVQDTAKKTQGAAASTSAYAIASRDAAKAVQTLHDMASKLGEQNASLKDRLAGLTDQQIDYNRTLDEANALYAEHLALGPPTLDAQNAYNAALDANREQLELRNRLEAANDDAMPDRQRGYDGLANAARSYADVAAEAASSVWDSWQRLAESGETRMRSYWDAAVDMVRRAVIAMLFEWAKTSVIGAFGGGGGGGWMGAAVSAVAGGSSGGGGGGWTGAAAQIGRDYVSGGSGGTGGIFDSASWITAGRNLYSGFSSLMYGSGQTTMLGSYMGVANYGPGMATTYTPTGAGMYAGYAAGLAGAYYGFTQRGNGGSSSVAAGLSYGALGLGAVGAVGGIASGAGAIAGATGAFASLGAAAWIPVVGWILAILALVDVVAGGRLFGTKPRTEYTDAALNVGPDGPSSTMTLTKVRQRALFRGRDWSTYTGPGTPEMDEAARKFFDILKNSMLKVAKATGEELAPMIEASLRTINKYDKRGKVINTSYVATIRGKDYEEDTAELAAQRIQAEAILTQLGDAAIRAAERWRDSAEVLMEGATFLVAVQADVAKGNALFGSLSLDAVIAAVEGYQQGNESLLETYARLTGEVASIRDAFALAGAQLNKTGKDLVDFAAQMAQEAGGGNAVQQLWQSFFQGFYTQSELAQRQKDVLKPQLITGLAGLGLGEDTTMQQFRDAFERALPTLTAEQVVQWLQVGQALSTFNTLLAQTGGNLEQIQGAQRGYAEMVVGLDEQIRALTGKAPSAFQQVLAQIGANATAATRQLNDLARAAGMTAARTQDLTRVQELAALQAAQAARQLEAASRDIVQQLYGNTAIEQRAIGAGTALQSVASGLESVRDASARFRDQILLDDQLSPYRGNAQKMFQEAMRQLQQTGSEDIGRRVLEIGRRLRSTGADYNNLVDLVASLIRPQSQQEVGNVPAGAGPAIERPEMSEAQRLTLAQQLAQNVADLAGFGGKTFDEVAEMLGFSLTRLGTDLGLQGDALTDYLESMQAQSYGLDDLSTVLSKEVDRIVYAITTGGAMPLAPSDDEAGDRGTVVPLTTRIPIATRSAGNKSATEGDAEVKASIDAMADRVESALAALLRVAAATGEATEAAIRAAAQETRETARELRQLTETLHINGGMRAAASLA